MNVFVYDVAASESGALSILEDFYQETLACPDNRIHWTFVIGTPELESSGNVQVLRYSWVKKSWFHRIFFDLFTAPKLAHKYRADYILSLQNLTVPRVKVPQTVYIHQSLPFVPYRFSFSRNWLLWVYQNLIGRIILRSIRQANRVVIQTSWMKRTCAQKAGISEEKFLVIPPRLDRSLLQRYANTYQDTLESKKMFFYPAGAFEYKNHRLILDACRHLQKEGMSGYQVIFTLSGHEDSYAESLLYEVERDKLNVLFIGRLPREDVLSCYASRVLLFPSYIETYGMPLMEARIVNSIILAADQPFSKEILNGYGNAYFFKADDSIGLTELMKNCIDGKISYSPISSTGSGARQSLRDVVVNFAENGLSEARI